MSLYSYWMLLIELTNVFPWKPVESYGTSINSSCIIHPSHSLVTVTLGQQYITKQLVTVFGRFDITGSL